MDPNFILIPFSVEELKKLIAEAVATERKAQESGQSLPEWLTRKQVAEYLNISEVTVDALTRRGILKKYYPNHGKRPRFKKGEVLATTYEKFGRD